MGCIQSNKENFYNFFSARKINGASVGDKVTDTCLNFVGAPYLYGLIVSASKVQLSWTGGDGAVNYIVNVSTNNFTFVPVGNTTEKTFLVDDLDFSTTYYFRVDAVSYLGVESKSNVIEFTMPAVLPPTNLVLEYPEIRQIDLTWVSNSNSDEDGFVIQRSTDGINFSDLDTVGQNIQQYTDLSVLGDNTYYYRVAAFAGVNRTLYSNEVNQFIPIIPAPSLLQTAISKASQIDLTWVSNSDGYETGFNIDRSLDGVSFSFYDSVSPNVTDYIDINISSNVEYFYRVQAFETGAPSSTYSNIASTINPLSFRSFNNFQFGFRQFGEISDDDPITGFIFSVDSSQSGVGASDQFTFPQRSGTSPNFVMKVLNDTGQEITVTSDTDPTTFTFSSSGVYNIQIEGIDIQPDFDNTGDRLKMSDILNFGNAILGDGSFRGCENTTVSASDAPTAANGLSSAFSRTNAITQITGINDMDTSMVNTMSNMFSTSGFNSPVNNWDVTSIVSASPTSGFYRMFRQATEFNQPLNDWDMTGAGSLRDMFESATSFNQPLDNWGGIPFTFLEGVFNACASFDQDLSSWDFTATTTLTDFVKNSGLSSANYNALLAKIRSDAEGSGITFGLTLGADSLIATGQGVTDRTWLINNTGMTIIDATP